MKKHTTESLCIFLILIAICSIPVFFSYRDFAEWEMFAKEHNCKAVGSRTKSSDVVFITNTGGTVLPMVISGNDTVWLCADGTIHTR